jgi:hypothetical protein
MLEGLVLQFSALHFYFPRQEKKSLKEKREKQLSSGGLSAMPVPPPGLP